MKRILGAWRICAGLLLLGMIAAEVVAAPVELTGYFGTADAARISKPARMSGDGNKIVYVENLSNNFCCQSLSSWVSAQSMTTADAARVYLYDIATQTRTLLYESKFSSAAVGADTLLQSLEAGFSVDINRDGSKVVMAYSSTTFSGNRDTLTSSLKIALIDTASLAVTQVASFGIPGWTPQNTPLRMSENATTAVFAYEAVEAAGTPSGNTWGISYFGTSKTIKLMAVPLTASAQPVQLAAVVYTGDYSTSNDLVSFLDARYASFFDISADGTRVVFQYQGTGKVMGISSDGSGSREIAAVTPGKAAFASISGDGNVVAYADRGANNAVLYANAFDGGQQREITQNGTYWAGNLILNHDGSTLLFHTSEAGPGGSFGYSSYYSYAVPTSGSGTPVALDRELLDASEDFRKILTSRIYEPILFMNTLTIAPSTTSTSTSTSTSSSTSASTTTTTVSTTTTTLGGAATLNLVGGWNLLGNSATGTLDAAVVFGDGSKVTTVWKWIANGAKWAFYAPSLVGQALIDYASSKGYDVLTTINGGEGFWVNAKTAFAASLPSGTAINTVSFKGMSSGWNLIAVGDSPTPSAFNKSIGQTTPAAGEIPTNLTTLWAWDAAQSNWYFYAPSLEKSGGLATYIVSKTYLDFGTRVLDPTTGFWVNKP